MFHKAKELTFKKGTTLEVTFINGYVKSFDMASLFTKYPQLKALKNRKLFTSGKLMGGLGIIWNDELDIEIETIYEEGNTIRKEEVSPCVLVGEKIINARAKMGISQKELSRLTGIDQSDISKIERGAYNPSILTLSRIAKALKTELIIKLK